MMLYLLRRYECLCLESIIVHPSVNIIIQRSDDARAAIAGGVVGRLVGLVLIAVIVIVIVIVIVTTVKTGKSRLNTIVGLLSVCMCTALYNNLLLSLQLVKCS